MSLCGNFQGYDMLIVISKDSEMIEKHGPVLMKIWSSWVQKGSNNFVCCDAESWDFSVLDW